MKNREKRLALLGCQIQYSLSPQIHGLIMRYLGLKGSYELLDTEKFSRMDICAYDGLNVTKPFKSEVLSVIDEDCSSIGAVNTIVNNGSRLFGYNTDIEGFRFSLNTHQILPKNALILGAGGAARAAAVVLDNPCIWARDKKKAEALMEEFNFGAIEDGFSPQTIINCTSNADLILPQGISTDRVQFAFDFNYNRGDGFLRQFNDSVKRVDGRLMLIAQAVYAQQLFFDLKLTNVQINAIINEVGKNL